MGESFASGSASGGGRHSPSGVMGGESFASGSDWGDCSVAVVIWGSR